MEGNEAMEDMIRRLHTKSVTITDHDYQVYAKEADKMINWGIRMQNLLNDIIDRGKRRAYDVR